MTRAAGRSPEQGGTVIVRDGVVVYASEGAAALAGRPVAEIVGRPFGEFVVPEQRAAVEARYARRLGGEAVAARSENALALPGGGRRPVELHSERDGADVLVHLRDLSLAEARRLRLEAIATLGAALQRELGEDAIHARLRAGLRELGLSCALMRLEPGGVRIVWASVHESLGARFERLAGTPLEGYLGDAGAFAATLAREGYAFYDDWPLVASSFVPAALAAQAREAVAAAEIAKSIAVRLDRRDRADQALVVAGDWLRSDDGPAVRLFAAQVAAALDAARRIADLSRRNADLDALNRVGELAAQATDLGDFFARASEVLRAAATCAGVAVFVLDEPTGELACAYADGGAPPPGCSGEEALRRVLAARAPQVLALGPDPGPAPAPGPRSVALLPLLVRSKAVGVLAAAFEAPAEEVGGRVELLGAVAAHLAAAVESHGAFRDVSRRVSDLEAVNALALRIFENAPGDQKALVEAACREVVSALSCRGAAVFLAEDDGKLLRGAGGFGVAVDPAGLLIDLARDGLARDAMARRAPTWSEDVTADPRSAFYRHPRVPPLAMVAVPLGSRGATTGLLLLADGAGRRFTEAELALAVALAGGLGVGLENAQLYGDARRRVEELSLLNEVGRTIAGSLDLDRVLREGADAARRLVGASRAFVVLYDPLRAELRPGADAGFAEADLAAFRGAALERTLSARVIRERRPLVVDDVQASPEVDEAYRTRLLARSLAAAPVLLRGEPLGVLVVDETRRERRFAPADVDRVTAVANQLAVAIENARLYAEARGRLQELGTVIDVARVVSSSLDLEEVLGAGAEHLARTLGGSACTILLEDLRAQELRRAATRGGPVGPDRVRLDEPSLPRDALEARAPVTGRAASPGGPDAPVLAVPLHVRDHPVGVALVAAAAADRVFGPGELARAIAIASQLAVAVDNARLYSETRRRAEELGLLHEVGRSLVATLDIERVLEAGVRNLARIVDAPDAYLALVGPDRAQAEICAVAGPHSEMRGLRLPLEPPEHNLASIVLHRREPLVIEDGLTDPIVNQRLRSKTGGRGYLALPLLVRDRTIGAIIITDPRGPRRFTPAEVERAAAIANQLAVAVENARLYEDLRRSYADLERAQQQLIQRERLAALGELAAIVAHEVRNPLGVIFNSLGSLRRLLRPAGDAKLLLDIVGEEADRLNRIVGDLLDFARPSTPELRPEPLERVVEEAVGAALAQRPAGVEVRRELDASVPPVPMDARLVRQAVLNVAVNAIQAMPRGGRIVVRTRREGDAAVLEIEDTGAGIPEEVRGRIFEPFFTTKASGTGLGLAVVKRIVEGHGGAVSVASRPGAGAIFALRFPLSPAPVEKAPAMG